MTAKKRMPTASRSIGRPCLDRRSGRVSTTAATSAAKAASFQVLGPATMSKMTQGAKAQKTLWCPMGESWPAEPR